MRPGWSRLPKRVTYERIIRKPILQLSAASRRTALEWDEGPGANTPLAQMRRHRAAVVVLYDGSQNPQKSFENESTRSLVQRPTYSRDNC